MQNKYLRSIIITFIQFLVPVLLLLILIPQLLSQADQIKQTQVFFKVHHFEFLIFHGLFYLLLVSLWPCLITQIAISRGLNADSCQIKTALSARWYLVFSMVLFELIFWWSQA